MNDQNFYLGRLVPQDPNQPEPQPALYEPEDLTTHAVVVGMTGSGKTGLCLTILEEAALQGIPALMIDPKGDITNALLHFPDMRPEDFQPWVNPDLARRDGMTVEQAAAAAAESWSKGLAEWGITSDRIRKLQQSVRFAVFTPGSDAGLPVSILASLQAPGIPWESNREALREKISGTVTALLGLVGLTDLDPVRSREHILLSNIFEHAWKDGKDLDMSELILQTQSPPFQRLGVFDINTFFPEKDRFGLAMLLNNIIAAPAFQPWIEGQALDIGSLLYSPDGKPRHSIFYIAHLSESERMFFVTLLYSAIESWMRTQSGTTSLRALVYFDEIYGYLPPLGNPPSKTFMLRMLKQARAFGVGQILATQNPVDVDYKALSNAGTWFIGKLQTDQDKQRLLDGLQGAAPAGLDRSAYDQMISGLGKRVFLMHNVHNKAPLTFQTRWAMNYMPGPLTRLQIPALNRLAQAALPEGMGTLAQTEAVPGAATPPPLDAQPPLSAFQPVHVVAPSQAGSMPSASAPAASAPAAPELPGSTTRPPAPAGVAEYFLPNNLSFSQAVQASGSYAADATSLGLVYRPVLLGQARVRFLNRKYNLDAELARAVQVEAPDRRGVVRWENFQIEALDPRGLDSYPAPQSRFVSLEAPLSDAKTMAALQKDFVDWVYRATTVTVRANENLKVYAGPELSSAEFRELCAASARQSLEAEQSKVAKAYDKKLQALEVKLAREERELEEDEEEHSQRKMEELGTHAENLFGLFGGRKSTRRLSSSLSKRRMTAQAKADIQESREAIDDLKQQLAALEQERDAALAEAQQRWGEQATAVSEITVPSMKKDILVDLFGIAWLPYHLMKAGGQTLELPGFRRE